MVSLLATAAMAQVKEIPADTRLYLQTLEAINQKAYARSMNKDVHLREAKLFISCASSADTKAVEQHLKTIGAKPQGTIGRYILVSTPVGLVDRIANIKNVTYISKSPSASLKTVVSKESKTALPSASTPLTDGSSSLPRSTEAALACQRHAQQVYMPYRLAILALR